MNVERVEFSARPTGERHGPEGDDPSTRSCCVPLSGAPISRSEAVEFARVLKAIADPARLQLISLIRACTDCEACVCDLTEPLGLSQPTVSHHLRVLSEAGLVTKERRGTWMFYRLVPNRLAEIRDALA